MRSFKNLRFKYTQTIFVFGLALVGIVWMLVLEEEPEKPKGNELAHFSTDSLLKDAAVPQHVQKRGIETTTPKSDKKQAEFAVEYDNPNEQANLSIPKQKSFPKKSTIFFTEDFKDNLLYQSPLHRLGDTFLLRVLENDNIELFFFEEITPPEWETYVFKEENNRGNYLLDNSIDESRHTYPVGEKSSVSKNYNNNIPLFVK